MAVATQVGEQAQLAASKVASCGKGDFRAKLNGLARQLRTIEAPSSEASIVLHDVARQLEKLMAPLPEDLPGGRCYY